MNPTNTKLIKTLGAAIFMAATSTNAAVIFQDDFSGLGTTDLNGATLTVNNQDSQTWMANGQFKANGTVSGSNQGAAYLDFTPTAGNIYTLSATLTAPATTNNNWIALGFVQDTSALNIRHSDAGNGIAWVLHRNSTGNDVEFFAGPGTGSGQYTQATTAQSNAYVITLDATDSDNVLMSLNVAGGALEVDGFNAGTLASLGINGVGFSHDSGGVSSFDNFELSVVPEPSTAMLGAIGALALLRRRR